MLRKEAFSKLLTCTDPFVASLFDLPAVSPFPYPAEMSWDEKQEQARIARERKRYEASINEVTSELESMRTKVAELLEENNALPEAERMDGRKKYPILLFTGSI